ncbi:hypothetical protein [Salicola sp. Rm-C-2C1-2]|uniref:hypothetical protein n=1 Tax=Salicola sp. Rm-C-2C1-2 TaxID=3141321 RepID=UPI0032E3ADF0
MDKSWLIDRKVVSIIKAMRGHIRSEFGESVSLTNDQLFVQLKGYADASRSQQLKSLLEQLETMIQPPEPEPAQETPHKIYRGRVVAETAPAADDREYEGEKAHRFKSVRIYRGQRVSP